MVRPVTPDLFQRLAVAAGLDPGLVSQVTIDYGAGVTRDYGASGGVTITFKVFLNDALAEVLKGGQSGP